MPATIAEPYELGAQVQPYRRVEVRSRVEGIVIDRPFDEGSVVSKGQVLYKLDQVKYEAAYRSAVARLDNAKRTVARLEPLVPKHAVAQQDVDNARSELESAQAVVDVAKKDLDDCVIRAEINGQVGRARLQLGARVTGPADLLTTIDELDPVYVTFHPSSQQLATWESDPRAGALIRPGSSLAVRVAHAGRVVAAARGQARLRCAVARFGERHRGVPRASSRMAIGGCCPASSCVCDWRALRAAVRWRFRSAR